MALKEQINDDLKAALLGGNRFDCDVLRGLKAVILNEEVARGLREEGLSDELIQETLAKEMKKRNDSADVYDKAGRADLAKKERDEIEVILKYLPKQLSEAEITKVIDRIVDENGGKDACQVGKIIGAVKKELGNSADGSTIASLVKSVLS